MTDETQVFEKPIDAATEPKAVTETQTTTTSKVVGRPKPDESMIGGISGRFWIALVFAVGFVALAVLLTLYGKNVDGNLALTIFTTYATAATMVVGTYIGQGTKPKSQNGG